ncbi:hypothetical protein [Magnetospirillum sp. 15-1]|uniref:hypothetical protein n=1 Tax=Magnetospirillum sp. 15-1 TaxID=1979370 RepID=UPI000BBB7CB6|nr:hypothetical protein [Magnetospirillum sp. 15-1]
MFNGLSCAGPRFRRDSHAGAGAEAAIQRILELQDELATVPAKRQREENYDVPAEADIGR